MEEIKSSTRPILIIVACDSMQSYPAGMGASANAYLVILDPSKVGET